MAAEGQSNGKAKGRKNRAGAEPAEVLAQKDLSEDNLEIIPTAVPRQGDGYSVADTNGDGMTAGLIGEVGKRLTEEDLRRINTPRGLIQLIKSKTIDLEEVRNEVAVVFPPDWHRFPNSFSHIFAGGYAAGYYSYKWAEVLSADAYAAFEETSGNEGLPSPETGRKYRQEILEAGGSRPAMESFKAFRGREPSLDALLRHQGMA